MPLFNLLMTIMPQYPPHKSKSLEKPALLVICSLLFLPYLFYEAFLFDAPEYAGSLVRLLITLHLVIISLIITTHVFSQREEKLNYPIDPKQDSLLLIFLVSLCLSFFQAAYKSVYFIEISFWIQALYIYFMVSLIINFNAKDKIDPLITIMITTGTVIAVAMSIETFYDPANVNLSHNPIAEYLIIPFYLSCYRLYGEQNSGKRTMYWCILLSMMMFILLSKSRAAWLGLAVCYVLFLSLKKNLVSEFERSLRYHPWEKVILVLGIIGCVVLGLVYNNRLHFFNQVGLDNTFQSFIQLNEGSIYSRLKLWINSLVLFKDHFFLGVG